MRLFLISLSFICLCTLFPFQFDWSRYLSFLNLLQGFEQRIDPRDFLLNIILFMPLGMSLHKFPNRWSNLLFALLFCAAVSGSVEVLQLSLPGRNPNLLDIVSNSLGGVLGYSINDRWRRKLSHGIQTIGGIRFPTQRILAALLVYFILVMGVAIALPGASSLASWDTHMPLLLGNEKTGDRPWSGWVKEVYFVDRAWSEPEIKQALAEPSWNIQTPVLAAYLLSQGNREQTGNLPEFVWQGTPGEVSEKGVRLDREHWLATRESAAKLAERIQDTSQFTFVATIAPARFDQRGPARIISYSESPFSRNLTLGQQATHLHIRLRTFANNDNGTQPEWIIPNFFTSTDLQRLVMTYKGATLRVEAQSGTHVFNYPTDFNGGSPEKFMLYHSLLFVPLGLLVAMAIRGSSLGNLKHWRVGLLAIGVVLPSLIVESVLAVKNSRNASLNNVLLGVLFTGATAFIYWIISSRSSSHD
jgi:glycopeptide antibiotics resistance protein